MSPMGAWFRGDRAVGLEGHDYKLVFPSLSTWSHTLLCSIIFSIYSINLWQVAILLTAYTQHTLSALPVFHNSLSCLSLTWVIVPLSPKLLALRFICFTFSWVLSVVYVFVFYSKINKIMSLNNTEKPHCKYGSWITVVVKESVKLSQKLDRFALHYSCCIYLDIFIFFPTLKL